MRVTRGLDCQIDSFSVTGDDSSDEHNQTVIYMPEEEAAQDVSPMRKYPSLSTGERRGLLLHSRQLRRPMGRPF